VLASWRSLYRSLIAAPLPLACFKRRLITTIWSAFLSSFILSACPFRCPAGQTRDDYYHIWTYNPRFYSLPISSSSIITIYGRITLDSTPIPMHRGTDKVAIKAGIYTYRSILMYGYQYCINRVRVLVFFCERLITVIGSIFLLRRMFPAGKHKQNTSKLRDTTTRCHPRCTNNRGAAEIKQDRDGV
jgi:hypothetical protein